MTKDNLRKANSDLGLFVPEFLFESDERNDDLYFFQAESNFKNHHEYTGRVFLNIVDLEKACDTS